MTNTPPTKRHAKQAEKRHGHNASLCSMVRTHIKNVMKTINVKDLERAQVAFITAVPAADRVVDKGIIHKSKAARHKNRLSGHTKVLSTTAA